MSSVLNKLFGGGSGDGENIEYEKAKQLAAKDSVRQRRKLAARDDVQPEILYYLAEDTDPEVRRAVAANSATPAQADLLLVGDADDLVRCGLAGKIARLAPQLNADEQDKVRGIVVEVLEKLARDEVPRVRRILAEELKDSENVPAGVIQRLARDEELEVAAPVLENSPLLSDEMLLEIISSKPVQGALGAISRRTGLGEDVSDAVAASDDEQAITALLANSSAQIREETLDALVDRAENATAWHQPLVQRPALSQRAIRQLSEFVAESMLDELQARDDIDPNTARLVAKSVRRRLNSDDTAATNDAGPEQPGETPELRAQRMQAEGQLNEDAVLQALGKGDRGFVSAALALMAALPPEVIQKVASLESAKGMTALAWKAGLSMRTGVQLQLRLARIAPSKILQPKGGTDFPMTPEEMSWQLDIFAG